MQQLKQKHSVSVVLIEDDPDDVFLTKDLLSETRFLECSVSAVSSYDSGLEEILKNEADVYLIDHFLGAGKGVDLIAQAREAGIKKPLILLTGNESPEVDRQAQAVGASDYILKSEITTSLLERSMRYAISQSEMASTQEQLLREQLLREEAEHREAQWQLLSETIPYGLWVTDATGKVEYISRSFLQLVQVPEESKSSNELYFQDVLTDTLRDKWRSNLKEGKRWSEEMQLTDQDGNVVYVLSRGLPVTNSAGEVEQWVGINLDITREKRVDQRKDEFLRIASHELKSPIMSILSSLYILEDELVEGKTDVCRQYVVRIKRQLKNLTQLVEDLLDLSKIEMQKLTHYPEIFCLNDIVEEVVDDLSTNIEHQIEVEMPADVYLKADKQRIRQVLVNLLSNAVKYSPDENKVELKIDKYEDAVAIVVTDYGIGISEKERKKIFDKFYSGEDKEAKKISGLGLGLFLTQKIVELHMGDITVTSQKGSGTTFRVTLPLKNEKD